MKPRHAAALALVGWYLMAPNNVWTKEKKFFGVIASPCCEDWLQVDSYETFAECKTRKANMMFQPSEASATKAKLYPKEFEWAAKTAVNDALCIATDDPRLAK
jgi:hypothetical protein